MIYVIDHVREIAWEVPHNRVSEVVGVLNDYAYRVAFSFAITRDADAFRSMHPRFVSYKIVQTFDEFKGGDRNA